MARVGIRALKQNASAVVGDVRAGEVVTITDRGRPVARLVPLGDTLLAVLIEAGLARAAKGSFAGLGPPPPPRAGERPLGEVLAEQRDDERY